MIDKEKVEAGVRLILEGIGEDVNREGLLAVSYTHLTLPTNSRV